MQRIGKLKLLAVSGIFIQNDDSRIDMLIVADDVKDRSLKNLVSTLESEVGKELRYAILGSQDFKYRLGIHDRLVRDVFDYPHQVVVDRLGFEL
jgi:spore coat polysaccharide biosynthesis predicted glycosyltransferase SpsG